MICRFRIGQIACDVQKLTRHILSTHVSLPFSLVNNNRRGFIVSLTSLQHL